MQLLALELGDAATWGGTLVTFCMACFAVAQGVSQRRDLRQQNELQAEATQLQRRQIETAERRALAMERLLAQLTAGARQSAPTHPDGHLPAADGPQPEPVPQSADSRPGGAQEPVGVPEGGQQGGDQLTVPLTPAATRRRQRNGAQPPAPPPGSGGMPHSGYGYPQPGSPDYPFARPGSAAFPPAFSAEPGSSADGRWRLERLGRYTYALTNTGPSTATGVHISRANLPASARGVPEDAVVRAGESVEFLIAAGRGEQLPAELHVSCHGHTGVTAVPLPAPDRT